jgi:hypothetical protein
MEAASAYKTSGPARLNGAGNLDDSHIHTDRRQNLKSYFFIPVRVL